MSRTFLYARVSTAEQTTANQVLEVHNAGFPIEPHRIEVEIVSGSVPAKQRAGLSRLLDKMEQGDVLVVTKLDRLGRDAVDMESTFADLELRGISIHCIALGDMNLTSASGKLYRKMLSAFAQFERDLLVERTQAGLARAKAEGKRLGRPVSLSSSQRSVVRDQLAQGVSVAQIARDSDVSRATIMRLRDAEIATAK